MAHKYKICISLADKMNTKGKNLDSEVLDYPNPIHEGEIIQLSGEEDEEYMNYTMASNSFRIQRIFHKRKYSELIMFIHDIPTEQFDGTVEFYRKRLLMMGQNQKGKESSD